MQKGIITLSFDDGRKDTFHVFKDILLIRKLPGVVYIPSGYIETGYNDPHEIGFNGLMSRDELDSVYEDGIFEIGAHGDFHKNEYDDIKSGLSKLQEWFPDIKEFGFASPHSELNENYVKEHIDEYKALGLKYVRAGRNFYKHRQLKRGIAYLAKLTKSPKLFVLCYKSSIIDSSRYFLNTVAINRFTTLEQLMGIVDYCISNKAWAILEFHGIDRADTLEYTDHFCWLEDDFIKLCDYLEKQREKGNILIENPINAINVIQDC